MPSTAAQERGPPGDVKDVTVGGLNLNSAVGFSYHYFYLTQRAQRMQSYSSCRDESIPFGFHLSGERSSYFVETHNSR